MTSDETPPCDTLAEVMTGAWRMSEWNALPDACFIAACDGSDIDERGPVMLRDGSIHKACVEHWGPIFRVLGEQATWESTDAMHGSTPQARVEETP